MVQLCNLGALDSDTEHNSPHLLLLHVSQTIDVVSVGPGQRSFTAQSKLAHSSYSRVIWLWMLILNFLNSCLTFLKAHLLFSVLSTYAVIMRSSFRLIFLRNSTVESSGKKTYHLYLVLNSDIITPNYCHDAYFLSWFTVLVEAEVYSLYWMFGSTDLTACTLRKAVYQELRPVVLHRWF